MRAQNRAHFVGRYLNHAVSFEAVTMAFASMQQYNNWKNNNALGPRMMENGLCKYGEIWLNMDKINIYKKGIAVRMKSQLFSYFHQNKNFQKTIGASLKVTSGTTEVTNGTWNDTFIMSYFTCRV